MNEHLRDRVLRKLEALSDERGYQVLDYVEFLESKYADRQAPAASSIFARFTEAVEDRLRAGRISATTIAETMSLMNRAMNVLNGVATGVAAAGRSVASDFAAASRASGQGPAGSAGTGTGASTSAGGAPVAGSGSGAAPPPPSPPAARGTDASTGTQRPTDSGEVEPPIDQ